MLDGRGRTKTTQNTDIGSVLAAQADFPDEAVSRVWHWRQRHCFLLTVGWAN